MNRVNYSAIRNVVAALAAAMPNTDVTKTATP